MFKYGINHNKHNTTYNDSFNLLDIIRQVLTRQSPVDGQENLAKTTPSMENAATGIELHNKIWKKMDLR